VCISHFPRFSVFLTIFQVLPCEFLIVLVGQFTHHFFRSHSVHLSLSTFFCVSCHIPGFTVCMSYFPCILVFSPFSRSNNVHFSFFNVLSVSCYISYPTVCFSFSMIFSFLAILQVLQWTLLIFKVSQFSNCIPGPTVCISHFPRFSVFLAYSRSYSVHFSFSTFSIFLQYSRSYSVHSYLFHVFQCFLPYFMSYSGCLSFSMFFRFLSILQVLECAFLIFSFAAFFQFS